jgi:hypothetical protein
MYSDGFRKLFWGFLFILIDFRIQGVDILPDLVGFIFFAAGFSILASGSHYFGKAQQFNIPMAVLSIFQIYERPVHDGGIQPVSITPFGILIGLAAIVLTLLVVYNLFMGIKEMAEQNGRMDLSDEAGHRWNQFLLLHVALLIALFLMFIPPLAFIAFMAMLIAFIVWTIVILGFLRRCEASFQDPDRIT